MTNVIAFPGLGIGPIAIQNSFQVFGFTIHWYGVFIALGVIAAFILCSRFAHEYDLDNENLLDLILFGLPTAIIFARIYYVIFELEHYKSFMDFIAIWEGGLAIYGGIIGGCLAAFVYCKAKKIKISKVFDIGAFGLLIGQIFGRWGNFVNVEAFGDVTNLPWRMELIQCITPEGFNHFLPVAVHPTFLYESLWNLGVLILLICFRKKMKFSGQIFLSYITLYGLGRFWIEGLRTDSLYFYNFRVSQLLAALCVIVGITLIVILTLKKQKEEKNKTEMSIKE